MWWTRWPQLLAERSCTPSSRIFLTRTKFPPFRYEHIGNFGLWRLADIDMTLVRNLKIRWILSLYRWIYVWENNCMSRTSAFSLHPSAGGTVSRPSWVWWTRRCLHSRLGPRVAGGPEPLPSWQSIAMNKWSNTSQKLMHHLKGIEPRCFLAPKHLFSSA